MSNKMLLTFLYWSYIKFCGEMILLSIHFRKYVILKNYYNYDNINEWVLLFGNLFQFPCMLIHGMLYCNNNA